MPLSLDGDRWVYKVVPLGLPEMGRWTVETYWLQGPFAHLKTAMKQMHKAMAL
jgi:hypothetical protein